MRRLVRFGLGVLLAWPVMAAAVTAPAGFVVSPAFQAVEVPADKVQVQYDLKVRNNTDKDQNFRLSVVDFGALDEQGGVAFLGQPVHELEHKYGLASWMRIEKDALFVRAGESASVLVTIENRPTLAPGGHYGAVLVTAVTDGGAPVKNRVGIKQVLSSLVLASKKGGERRVLGVEAQTMNASVWRLPTVVEHRFHNSGNLHLIPRGVVEVRDPTGSIVERAALNEASATILPESFRRYKAKLTPVRRAWMPGRYEVRTQYRYDGTEDGKVVTMTFWYAGQVVVWLTAVLAVAGAGVFGWWFWVRRRL